MTKPLSIGFPSGLFGEEALRLDILQQGDGWFAISKPVQIPFDDHPWQNGETHLIGAIRSQLEMGKPEIVRLGIQEPASAFGPEPEVSGVAVIADRTRTLAAWRDALGSFQLQFTYTLIAKNEDAPVEGGVCDLSIGMDDTRGRAFISNHRGKQAETDFIGGEVFNGWRQWTAKTRYPRRDQIRIHAHECGIKIAGELNYERTGRITLADTVRRGRINKGEDHPLHRCLLLHLQKVEGVVDGKPFEIEAPLPTDFATVLKRLRKGA